MADRNEAPADQELSTVLLQSKQPEQRVDVLGQVFNGFRYPSLDRRGVADGTQ